MKFTEKLKETTRKGTECIKRYAPELLVGSLILLATGVVYVVHKDKQERKLRIQKLTESGTEILRGWADANRHQGSGPL